MQYFEILRTNHPHFNGYEMAIELLMEAHKNNFQIVEIPVPVIYKDRDKILKKRTNKR